MIKYTEYRSGTSYHACIAPSVSSKVVISGRNISVLDNPWRYTTDVVLSAKFNDPVDEIGSKNQKGA